MSLNYTANTDFNGDGNFSECELDASWATLQVKKLLETSGTTTIEIDGTSFNVTNNDTFLEAVKAMVALNVSASIASDGCAVVSSLPIAVALGDINLNEVTGYWRINEPGPEYDSSIGKPSKSFPIYDSSSSKSHAMTTSVKPSSPSNVDKAGLGLYAWANITIPDSGGKLLPNDSDWTLGIKVKPHDKIRFKLSKGNTRISFPSSTIYASNVADATKSFPYPVATNAFAGQNIGLFLIKTENKFSIKIVDESGNIINFGTKTYSGDFIREVNINEDVVLAGQTSGANLVPFLKEMFVVTRVLSDDDIKKTFYLPPTFRFTLDGNDDITGNTLSYNGNSVELVGGASIKPNNNWGVANGFTGSHYHQVSSGDSKYINYDNFNFRDDFTLSFWVKTWGTAMKNLIYIENSSDSSKYFKVTISGSKVYIKLANGTHNKNYTVDTNISGSLNANWQHISLIQTHGKISLYINGSQVLAGQPFRYYSGGTAKINGSVNIGMENCKLQINPLADSSSIGVADLSLISGGVVRIDNSWTADQPNDQSLLDAIKDTSYFA